MEESKAASPSHAVSVNRFNRMEWAGAFGDLGTLIPFVVAYISMVGMEPFGILFAFGVSLIVCGAAGLVPRFLTGAQLALGSCDFSKDKNERFLTLMTAAFCIWNVGLGFLVGIIGAYLSRRGWLRL